MSSTSSSGSETSASSSKFNPIKVLYSKKSKVPVQNAPLYDNLQQFESALKYNETQSSCVVPVGRQELVKKREEEKAAKRKEEERILAEKNKLRFAQYQGLETVKKVRKVKNVLTRIESMKGPLGALKDCVDQRLRIKEGRQNLVAPLKFLIYQDQFTKTTKASVHPLCNLAWFQPGTRLEPLAVSSDE
ncbi:jg23815 [Pararge aegeria aegeria]|uniref:Jg23815 protein n=1 Tax=Pararge aegeria aegeria TaxID=348720 RepID=A0A8S4SMZ2_9NEOP|nr:jg23815 [Pararge aegeria aegeria]